MDNIDLIRQGILALIVSEGYTKSSYAKKCGLDKSHLSSFLDNKVKLSQKEITYIVEMAVVAQGLDETDLKKYIEKEVEFLEHEKQLELIWKKRYKSRDVDRIEPFLDELKDLWLGCPDLRFGQLVEMIAGSLKVDPFNAEEQDWIESIRKIENEK